MNLAFMVGVLGSLTGAAAGLAGTYLAIVSAAGPKEKAFMVRCAVVCWGAVVLVVAARFFLPVFWPVVTVGGVLVLRPALWWWSDRQVEIRHAERVRQLRGAVVDQESSLL